MNIKEFYETYGEAKLRDVLENSCDKDNYYDVSTGEYWGRNKKAVYFKDHVNMTDVMYLVLTLNILSLNDYARDMMLHDLKGKDMIYVRRMMRDVLGKEWIKRTKKN